MRPVELSCVAINGALEFAVPLLLSGRTLAPSFNPRPGGRIGPHVDAILLSAASSRSTSSQVVSSSRLMMSSPSSFCSETRSEVFKCNIQPIKQSRLSERRSKRCGFCPTDLPEFDELLEKSDDELFNNTINNANHALHQFLPPQSTASQHYHQLRHRAHDRLLPEHRGQLLDCNFITRLLYKNMY